MLAASVPFSSQALQSPKALQFASWSMLLAFRSSWESITTRVNMLRMKFLQISSSIIARVAQTAIGSHLPITCIHSKARKTPHVCPTKGKRDHSLCYSRLWNTASQGARGILPCTCVCNKSGPILLHSLLPLSKLPHFELERCRRIIMLG